VIRLFAGDRIFKSLDRLGPVYEDGSEVPLEAKMLTKTVENAQKKVEEQNFLIRKRVLEYDDVMNEQRRVVYKYRREILEGRDISETARDELEGVIERLSRSTPRATSSRTGTSRRWRRSCARSGRSASRWRRWRRRRSTAKPSKTSSTRTRWPPTTSARRNSATS